MNRRLFMQAATLASLAAAAPMLLAQTPAAKRNRIVIQVSDNDPAKWNLALNNARNLQEDVGAANVDIEIVAYGPGIGMLKLESPTGSRIADAMKANVKVIACENTMRGQKLTRDDMLPAISYVPAGVTEIMKKQGEGWAYLRP
ncbi:MAG: DsrE family protein [Pseudomonadota bacterium]